MNKKDPVILDLYYNANINKSSINEDIVNLYDTAKKIIINNKYSNFSSVKFSKKEKENNKDQRFVYYDPPAGPIIPGTKCSYSECGAKASLNETDVYHKKDCRTPSDEFLNMSKSLINKHKDKVNSFLEKKFKDKTQSELEEIKKIVFDGKADIQYILIFPKKGIKKGNSLEYKRTAFENTITLSYKSENNNKFYGSKKDFNTIIRISKNYSFYVTGAPYKSDETNFSNFPRLLVDKIKPFRKLNKHLDKESNDLIEKIDNIKKIDEYSWITVLRGNYNILEDKNKFNLNMSELNKILKSNITDKKINISGKSFNVFDYKYKFSTSTISFHIVYKGLNVYIEIKLKGSVKFIVSYGKKDQVVYGVKFPKISKMENGVEKINENILKELSQILKPFFIKHENEILKKIKQEFDEDKIYNMIIPPGYKGKTLLQPKICNTLNKSRPKPYSFKGMCKKGEYVDEQGLNWSKIKSKTFNVYDLYEPCCKKITGTLGNNIKFEKDSSISDKLKNVDSKIKNIDTLIQESEGNKKIFLRRLVYGFPNNLRETKTKKEMLNLFEDKTKKLENKLKNFHGYTVRDMDSPEVYGIEIINGFYVDNKTATYKPGTQSKEKGGDGTLVRESRVFKGLKQLLEEDKSKNLKLIFDIYYK